MGRLPRSKTILLNAYEFGWIHACFSGPMMKRMEKELPVVWLQFQIEFCKTYALSDGHPFQKRAAADLARYEKMLEKKLKEENEA